MGKRMPMCLMNLPLRGYLNERERVLMHQCSYLNGEIERYERELENVRTSRAGLTTPEHFPIMATRRTKRAATRTK